MQRRGAPIPEIFRVVPILSAGLFFLSLTGCMTAYKKSVGGETEKVFSRYYLADYEVTWQSVLAALKSSPLDIANKESGFLRTKWIDNTAERNFFDSFGTGRFYLKSKFRIRVNLSKGFFNGIPAVKTSIVKEQVVQRDVLEGWRPVVSDAIDEKTLLYRIGRLVLIQTKIAELERQKVERAALESGLGDTDFEEPPPPVPTEDPMTDEEKLEERLEDEAFDREFEDESEEG